MINEAEAFRRFHAQDQAAQQCRRAFRAIEQTLESLEIDLINSLVQQYLADKAFERAVYRFTGHTPYGWEVACGSDIRLIRLSRRLGWPTMTILITRIRKELYL